MDIRDFQRLILETYFDKDAKRGMDGTFVWLTEEVGELARAIREHDMSKMQEEFSDVFAWLVSLASLCEVDLQEAAGKYIDGCPKCGKKPCVCVESK